MLTSTQSAGNQPTKPTTVFCQHCIHRENNKKAEKSGFCSALSIYVMRKDRRAARCECFSKRKGAKIFEMAPMSEPDSL